MYIVSKCKKVCELCWQFCTAFCKTWGLHPKFVHGFIHKSQDIIYLSRGVDKKLYRKRNEPTLSNPNDDFSGNNMSCEDTLDFPRHHTKPLTDKLMDKKMYLKHMN